MLLFKVTIITRIIGIQIQAKQLICSHETDNPFDVFAIRACNTEGNTDGHLPRDLPRVTKLLLDKGADITAVLTEMRNRRSSFMEGGT